MLGPFEIVAEGRPVALTAHKPRMLLAMLVVPFAHDQPDNAQRVERLGISRTIPRRRYSAERAANELRRLLADPAYARRAESIGRHVREEDGVGRACDAIEALLRDWHRLPGCAIPSDSED